VVHLLTDGLVDRGVDVTLFATADSAETRAKLVATCPRPYSQDPSLAVNVWASLHISEVFERAAEFDLIHNHFDFLPLTYSGLVQTPVLTTIHGASSPTILPVYEKYSGKTYYVSISDADRRPELKYLATIHYGIPVERYRLAEKPGDYLLFFGRVHHDMGVAEAIEAARRFGMKLIIAGIIQDQVYFDEKVAPHLTTNQVEYIGPVGPEPHDELLGGAYALLHLINFDEPFGLSLIEAMACGTPVVARNRGAVPEIVNHGNTGFIVAREDEAVGALKRIPEINRADCRRVVEERFTRDRMVSDYLRGYEQILERARARRVDTVHDRRPWGQYWVLEDTDTYKVKRIDVLPGKRLSYQKHARRSEHWFIVRGTAKVTLDGNDFILHAGNPIDVPIGTAHRIENIGDQVLTFIEVQHGTYFGEDDIIRLQDDYGRMPA
jgi:glycosyltransferase involved in cell wall biosynthesis/mannose-6-phosphate isomerase-like protein (cupin superfamily)